MCRWLFYIFQLVYDTSPLISNSIYNDKKNHQNFHMSEAEQVKRLALFNSSTLNIDSVIPFFPFTLHFAYVHRSYIVHHALQSSHNPLRHSQFVLKHLLFKLLYRSLYTNFYFRFTYDIWNKVLILTREPTFETSGCFQQFEHDLSLLSKNYMHVAPRNQETKPFFFFFFLNLSNSKTCRVIG